MASTSSPVHPFVNASLYVGDLASTVDESKLYSIFEPIGHVLSVRVLRDSETQKSLGYAYVNYESPEDAERALSTLNYSLIDEKPCRIMWQQRDPTLRRSGVGNICVKNLPEDIDSKTLMDMFSVIGNVVSCKVATEKESQKSLGYGYIQFENVANAEKAIQQLNGQELNKNVIIVEAYNPKKSSLVANEWTNTYIKDFPDTWDKEELQKHLEVYGPISSILISDKDGAKFAFANFEKHDDAVKAIEELNEKPIPNEKYEEKDIVLSIQRYMSKNERAKVLAEQAKKERETWEEQVQERNLYVKNIAPEVTQEEFQDLFAKYGTITSATIMKSEDGVSKGFGFVCFSTKDEAAKAIVELNGKSFHNKPLFVALYQKKELRRNQLALAYSRALPMMAPSNPNMLPFYYSPVNRPMMMPQMPNMMPGQVPVYSHVMPQNQRRNNRRPMMNRNNRNQPMMHNNMMPMNPSMMMSADMNSAAAVVTAPAVPAASPAPAAVAPTRTVSAQEFTDLVNSTPMLDKATILSLDADSRRNALGERLYAYVSFVDAARASKITGMMLELDVEVLLGLLASPVNLLNKIYEAIDVLEKSN